MIYELAAYDYPKVKSLFAPMRDHLAVTSILADKTPGKIVVDDPRNPRAALAAIKRRRLFLVGDTRNDQFNRALAQFFADTLYPQAIQAGDKLFGLYFEPRDWEDRLRVILPDKSPTQPLRQHYLLKHPVRDWRALLPTDFSIRSVNRDLLADARIQNREELIEEMRSERASVDDFLKKSFGVCLIHADAIAGFCLSEYNVDTACEIGIMVGEPFRRRGLATALASAFIARALLRGVTQIGWHCYARNLASAATARKVGFELEREYTIFQAGYQ
ncbi:MAG: GNAT family N-acetyltransferase [Chloroflexi bacterium]|nr:GNAT family N-acetyltransferase [Chloroflexota bacterium]